MKTGHGTLFRNFVLGNLHKVVAKMIGYKMSRTSLFCL